MGPRGRCSRIPGGSRRSGRDPAAAILFGVALYGGVLGLFFRRDIAALVGDFRVMGGRERPPARD